MNYTLFDLFLNAYNGNSFAQLQIVQRFQPLLKKYAALLKYEDAYSDLQLYLLELLHSGKLTKLQRKDDGTLVKYIESSIRHQYISLNSRKNAVDNSVIASVDEIDFDQMSVHYLLCTGSGLYLREHPLWYALRHPDPEH